MKSLISITLLLLIVQSKAASFSYLNEIEHPDLTQPIDTGEYFQKALDTSACGQQTDVFDSNGNYVKTACAVFAAKRYSEACVNEGMDLFVVDSTESEQELLSFATSIYGIGKGSTLYINGQKDKDGKWYTYNPMKKPLIDSVAGRFKWYSENCLITKAFGAFEIDAWSCERTMNHFCEYKKAETVERRPTRTPLTTTTEVPSTTTTKVASTTTATYDEDDYIELPDEFYKIFG
jgi:hypothetical protein